MASRDGGLCRVKLPGGKLSATQATAIAEVAQTFATGVIELTNRANLQLRGVKAGAEAELHRRLIDAGLGPRVQRCAVAGDDSGELTDDEHVARRTAVADDVRNLMLSATAGCDAGALYDTTSLADTILLRLENEPRFAALSPKFSVLLDGGEHLAALDHPHDVWLSPMTVTIASEPMFALGFAGYPLTTLTTPGSAIAAIRASDVPALVHALLHTFIDLADDDHKRMRDLLRVHRADDVAHRAAARAGVTLHRDAAVSDWQRAPADPLRRFGAWPQRDAGLWHVGAQAPLGRLDAATLHAIATLSRSHAQGSFRVTPWQGLLITDVAERDVAHVEQTLDGLGMIRHAHTPLGRMIACAGSTGCAKALSDTKADARALAERLQTGVEVHVSGCVRSCASAHRAPWTLLAVGPGQYDLYCDATSDTAPDTPGPRRDDAARFGARVATHLTLEAIALRLNSQDRIAQP
ncbi:precorrin-3B synthase [Pandoraea sp. ISTKB]|uniref:precorrin-3B synthase n=1 Tax=Pandoraea sp. ISTKB TaxID=1586708 RepID=UPI000AE2DD2E|nr:precorrin-3B synthase [Pandoraea sp. ISTKB]